MFSRCNCEFIMKILVVICTYNRAHMLREALDSLVNLKPPQSADWSVLVVNNRCTDTTDQVIAEFADRLPIYRTYQPIQGLSNARNAAIASEHVAQADYIIWTDDDVQVDPDWLCAYESGFRSHPESCLFGGNVTAVFEKDPPKWLLQGWDTFKDAYAVRDFDDSFPLQASGLKIPYGANFAVRAAEQRQFAYDPMLGVVGDKWQGGEETSLMRELLTQGHTGWWISGATVRHFIPERRTQLAYLGKYFRGQGRTEAIRLGENKVPAYRQPRWLWRKMLQEWFVFLVEVIRGNPAAWSRHYRLANIYLGKLIN